MNQITNPHDKFFKEVFTHRETAMDFLRNYLPPEVVDLLDLDTFIFDFEYILWDAFGFSDEELTGDVRLQGSLLTFNSYS